MLTEWLDLNFSVLYHILVNWARSVTTEKPPLWVTVLAAFHYEPTWDLNFAMNIFFWTLCKRWKWNFSVGPKTARMWSVLVVVDAGRSSIVSNTIFERSSWLRKQMKLYIIVAVPFYYYSSMHQLSTCKVGRQFWCPFSGSHMTNPICILTKVSYSVLLHI